MCEDSDIDTYYEEIAEFCFGVTDLDPAYFASETDFYPLYTLTLSDYNTCLDDLYNDSTLTDTEID